MIRGHSFYNFPSGLVQEATILCKCMRCDQGTFIKAIGEVGTKSGPKHFCLGCLGRGAAPSLSKDGPMFENYIKELGRGNKQPRYLTTTFFKTCEPSWQSRLVGTEASRT